MLDLYESVDYSFHTDRRQSPTASSLTKSSSTDTNSSTQDYNSSIIDLNCQTSFRYYNLKSSSNKQTSLKSLQHLNKEKSELCRKFIQTGTCPYGFRCKFAHGAHELRQNQQVNNRYKTKECGAFFREGYCRFGNRCNFLHIKTNSCEQKKEIFVKIFTNHRGCIHEMREQSRLLKLLCLEQQ